MFSPCMCGDLYCNSCGHAQGNYYCSLCGTWTLDATLYKEELEDMGEVFNFCPVNEYGCFCTQEQIGAQLENERDYF